MLSIYGYLACYPCAGCMCFTWLCRLRHPTRNPHRGARLPERLMGLHRVPSPPCHPNHLVRLNCMNVIFCDTCCGIFKRAVHALLPYCTAHIFYSTSVLNPYTLLSFILFPFILIINRYCYGIQGSFSNKTITNNIELMSNIGLTDTGSASDHCRAANSVVSVGVPPAHLQFITEQK